MLFTDPNLIDWTDQEGVQKPYLIILSRSVFGDAFVAVVDSKVNMQADVATFTI